MISGNFKSFEILVLEQQPSNLSRLLFDSNNSYN